MITETRKTMQNLNPATLEVIHDFEVMDEAQVDSLLLRATTAQKEWGSLSLKDRARHIHSLRKQIVTDMNEIIHTICEETGKTEMDGLIEVFTVCEHLKYIASMGPQYLSKEKRSAGLFVNKKVWVQFQPKGVIGIISPWNYPFILTMGPIAQALMAGNGVVVKPSEITPATTLKIREVASRAGLPEDILLVATGEGSTGAALVKSEHSDMICFTGSTATGRKIAEQCGKMLKPVILELGGKDPMIVFADANLDRAARGAVWGGFSNSGQTCISVERVYVESSVHDKFVELVKQHTEELLHGHKDEENGFPSIGSMTFEKQVGIVEAHLQQADELGGQILRPLKTKAKNRAGGYFLEPAVVIEAHSEMQVMRDETFGPMIAIQSFVSDEEVIEKANATGYGLNASVWSRDKKKARAVAEKIKSGSVCINDVDANYIISDLPFGGMKESGIGRVYGKEGIRAFADMQSVLEDRFGLKRELWWFPYSQSVYKLFQRVVRILFG